jgi:putative YphP/YqiW family bacilliredoxin
MYPEELVTPMREELTSLGVQELRTAEDVDAMLGEQKGTVLLVVNSICGCGAANARPAVKIALQHNVKPERISTVFAGQDARAVKRAREYISGYPPSSPSMALFKDGKLVHMVQRSEIEGFSPESIAANLTDAFDRFCR